MRFRGPHRSANTLLLYYASHRAFSRPEKKLTSEASVSKSFCLFVTEQNTKVLVYDEHRNKVLAFYDTPHLRTDTMSFTNTPR